MSATTPNHWRTRRPVLRMLDSREERLLARLRDFGGVTAIRARNKLVLHNMALATKIASKHPRTRIDRDDVYACAYDGLVRAAIGFDPDQGRFSTYATFHIRAAVQRGAVFGAGTIRVSMYGARLIRRSYGNGDPLDETCRAAAEDALRAYRASTGSHDPDGDGDLLRHYSAPAPDPMEDCGFPGDVDDLLRTLTDRDRLVIELMYGIDPRGPMILKEVGEILGITRERVRQIHDRSLARLKCRVDKIQRGVLSA